MIDLQLMGQRIRTLRKKHKMSGRDLAKRIGITPSALSGVEGGRRGISIEVAARISEIFGVSVDYILGISGDPKMSPEWEGIRRILRNIPYASEKDFEEIEKNIVENTKIVPYLNELKDEISIEDQIKETTNRFFLPASFKADFVIEINFDLLEPEYMEGDIVACLLSSRMRDGDSGTGIFYQRYEYMFRDESEEGAPLKTAENREYIFRSYKAFGGKVILTIPNPKYRDMHMETEVSIFEFRKNYELIAKITGFYRSHKT
ncbi:helix-turn-helix domain-containing protein [Athalassotoga saccharophila]|uniref:HTH cro/C1-type domain-containing protein n=1 Tax=Athalassotoga saccharophila TaxID=1441386 RepID=A0A6N4TDI6_9BACT|nr:helix-turn-helix transcriptional regulator [Athalassotoga saccharophila]BBJ29058.1 hypothetical protein ATHSA_p10011 [Athalassotoga saccharophila]